ncbi:nuclease-related domain protein [Mycolicibacterium hassiacum DSM 44199]|uniref:non-specific serine/threonine protein kinase n=1 Tax=Mycolicibacterium hassiacum (strain DSM 44199 / CIP 105218 / JCM 12690 / 3849) TaxID=1122247 RepID=K5B789_MYCHD|nr:BREX system serine/threonine kinase PglW [Mycolicibacterium hassiacum]EKF21528.1 nuclease-related domain protein [Mycolicibacterium hassiacum DSM 44199]MDA4087747.1 protein kinase [Mycolicibacterium hassiacum DSM 44199]VCT90270.1 Serine/threonine-protein kinase PknH [Mycolicibacterium hassiacum DSM 44199]
MKDGRWVTIAESQFDHEKQGLEAVKRILPDTDPFRAWANFEFRDNRGRWHEVDLLVLGRDRLYLIELKHYCGILTGNDHLWRRNNRTEDSPLLLARRKAQYFASLLKDAIRERGGDGAVSRIPWVQELVFLHHEQFKCELPPSSKINLYGLDGHEGITKLPGISKALLAPATHEPISERDSLLIAGLMKAIGLAPRRQREVGSWIIDEQPLADGEGWQDWPAFHHVNTEDHVRIRFYTAPPSATRAEEHARRQAVTHEYHLLSRLTFDGLQAPKDLVDDPELGIGLVFPQPKSDTPLDLWLADHTLSLEQQLDLIAKLADIVHYAHRNRVVHRGLNPRSVAIRERAGELLPQVLDWDSAGILPANPDTAVTRLSGGSLTLMAGAASDTARLFSAPEGPRPTDPARIDVFGLGALAFFILTGGTAPATERGELIDRLRRDRGLDLAADMPQVRTPLRQLVLDATNPSPADRIADVGEFVARLDEVRNQLLLKNAGVDPLEAGPGDELAGGRFIYERKLGAGSTAVGILVKDNQVGGALRVLKVSKDHDAAERLRAEAQVLGRFENDDRIVTLHGVEEIGGRTALILRYAGRTTLAEELNNRGRLSIDVLQRWGTDLLTALVALERSGVTHRDIKPSNLGVHQSSTRADTHLVMFDFSMAGVSPDNVEAGTPPYLDPFLGTGGRTRYDTAAERYGAAVVLFEMATGKTPHYGPDAGAHPATVNDDVTVEPEMFEAALAPAMVEFFTSALSRDTSRRPGTAEDMLRAWKQAFDAADSTATAQTSDVDAEKADITTALTAAGLSARAVSALATVSVTTVGELLALDSTTLNRLVAREAKDTRNEIRERYRAWTKRLGKQQRRPTGTELRSLDDTVALLLSAVSSPRSATTRRDAAALLLGTTPGLDGFASSAELAEKLGKAPQRGTQLIKELQEDWANNPATREVLDALTDIALGVIDDFGGVTAVSTLTAEIRARLPESGFGGVDSHAERAAAGLLRVALDRLHEHETATAEITLVRRRHGRRLALLATDELLISAAEAAARRADELVSADPNAIIPANRAAEALRAAFQGGYNAVADTDATAPMPGDGRLVRLAAAISKHAAVSGRGELHNKAISPAAAVAEALRGLAQSESLSASQIRSRVSARFPELDRVPQRPHLDTILAQTALNLTWDPAREVYRFPDAQPPSVTTLQTRQPTALPATDTPRPEVEQASNTVAVLRRSLDEAGFVAIGVQIPRDRPGEHERVAQELAQTYEGELVDVTTELIAGMRQLADERGIPWDVVRAADAPTASPRDAQGLRAVIDRVAPVLRQKLRAAVFEGEYRSAPLILTEVSPLARYEQLDLLAELSDLAAPRRRPVWVVLPQLHGQVGALVDRKPIQLGAPGGQFVLWREALHSVLTGDDGGQQ